LLNIIIRTQKKVPEGTFDKALQTN